GADGATHHGAYDLAYMRCIPNMVVSAPMNEQELRNLMFTASQFNGPFVIRYPRGEGVMIEWQTPFESLPIGKGRTLIEGREVAFLTIGAIGNLTTKAIQILNQQDIYPGHYDLRYVKPLDAELLHHICQNYPYLITVEDGCLMGGFGSAILEFMSENGYTNRVKRLGIPDAVIEHGTQTELYKECGYDTEAQVNAVVSLLQKVQS
ncbi:MAG: 1-deoxy-D-xylulose-5-phosphate synthase, partial [Bacteroidia bacterium]|nr:1-deoxy-D-xylulose-5-phosphate synthase [Bacteroidia bacterium]